MTNKSGRNGDYQIIFEVKLDKFKMGTCKISGIATVDGVQVAEAEILASVVDRRK